MKTLKSWLVYICAVLGVVVAMQIGNLTLLQMIRPSIERIVDEKIAKLPAPVVHVEAPKEQPKPDLNKVCAQWLFNSNLKLAKEQICKR